MTDENAGAKRELKDIESARSSASYFSAFICFLGFVLFVSAILTALWPAEGSQNPGEVRMMLVVSILCYLLGVAGVFLASISNARRDDTRHDPSESRVIERFSIYRRSVAVTGIGLVLAALVLVPVASREADGNSLGAAEFALTLPIGGEPSAIPKAGEAEKVATVFWSVPEEPRPFRSGLLLMILASLVITIYGMIYPVIASDNQAADFFPRLVIPAIGFVLFGFGASSQVAAEERRENINLVARGLAPVASLSREERSAYFLRETQLSSASTAQLQAAIERLATNVENLKPETSGLTEEERQQILTQINNVESSIRERRTVVDSRTSAELRNMRADLRDSFVNAASSLNVLTGAVREMNASSRDVFAALDGGQRALLCAVLRTAEINAEIERRGVLARTDHIHGRERENVLTRTWLSIIGRHPDALERERQELSAALGNEEQHRRLLQKCEELASQSN